jgi:hypothetical protein
MSDSQAQTHNQQTEFIMSQIYLPLQETKTLQAAGQM